MMNSVIASNKENKANARKAYLKALAEMKKAENAVVKELFEILDDEPSALPAKALANKLGGAMSKHEVAGNLCAKRYSRYAEISSRSKDLVIEYHADRYALLDDNGNPTGVIKEFGGCNYYRTKK